MHNTSFRCGPDDAGRRFDRIIVALISPYPASLAQKLIRTGKAKLNGVKAKASQRVSEGDVISLKALGRFMQQSNDGPLGIPQHRSMVTIRAPVILETDDLLFLDKPEGLLSHGAGSLGEDVINYVRDRSRLSIAFNPSPLNRLDHTTRGIICYGIGYRGAADFAALLRSGSIEKRYLAVLSGEIPGEYGIWVDSIARDHVRKKSFTVTHGGHEARLSWEKLYTGEGMSLIDIRLETGLTHQIRCQAASRGYPLVGDRKYGAPYPRRAWGFSSYYLRAYMLRSPSLVDLIGRDRLIAAPNQDEIETLSRAFRHQMEEYIHHSVNR